MRPLSSSFFTILEHLRLSTPSSFQSSLWSIPSGWDWIRTNASSSTSGIAGIPRFPHSENRGYGKNIIAPDNNGAKTAPALVVDKFYRLVHMDIEVLVHCYKPALEFTPLILDFNNYFGINEGKHFLYRQNNSVNHLS